MRLARFVEVLLRNEIVERFENEIELFVALVRIDADPEGCIGN